MTYEQIKEEVFKLPVKQQLQLVISILKNLQSADEYLEDIKIVEARIKEIDDSTSNMIT
jgi:NADH:ubiquinone oxidoreductase subunit E